MLRICGKTLIAILVLFSNLWTTSAQDNKPPTIERRKKESADSLSLAYFFDSANQILAPAYYPVDTSLHLFHHYQPLLKNGRNYAWLGNAGLAYSRLVFEHNINPESQYGINSFDAYRITPTNLPYYQVNQPFTVLAYSTGRHREQTFSGRHYQQVLKSLGVGVHFNIINSMGSYERQKADNASFALQALFRSPNQRYGIAGNFINNRFIHRENGGIANPPEFENNTEPNRSRMTVRLYAAENQWRESNTIFSQYLHLSNPVKKREESPLHALSGFGTLVHKFNYQRLAMVYDDTNPRSGYYPAILIDSVRTHDSLVVHTVYNDIQWVLPLIESHSLNFRVTSGLAHTLIHYRAFSINTKYNQLIPFIKPEIQIANRLVISAYLEQTTGDFRNNDQEIRLSGSYKSLHQSPVTLEGMLKRKSVSPALFYQLFESNHFAWENNFGQQKLNEVSFSAKWKGLKGGGSLLSINGFAFFDTLAMPAWYGSAFTLTSVFADLHFRWRKFSLDTKVTFQHISDETALRLPKLLVNPIISYEQEFFEGALQAMGGLELYYNTSWKAPAYMPATRSFFIQNHRKTGNYPYIDVFINLRMKRARLFFLLQHLNQGFTSYDYYMIPGYPMPDRAFKFGINWMFFD